jgi:hypothetical protein
VSSPALEEQSWEQQQQIWQQEENTLDAINWNEVIEKHSHSRRGELGVTNQWDVFVYNTFNCRDSPSSNFVKPALECVSAGAGSVRIENSPAPDQVVLRAFSSGCSGTFKDYVAVLDSCVTITELGGKGVIVRDVKFDVAAGNSSCAPIALNSRRGRCVALSNSSSVRLVNSTFGDPMSLGVEVYEYDNLCLGPFQTAVISDSSCMTVGSSPFFKFTPASVPPPPMVFQIMRQNCPSGPIFQRRGSVTVCSGSECQSTMVNGVNVGLEPSCTSGFYPDDFHVIAENFNDNSCFNGSKWERKWSD